MILRIFFKKNLVETVDFSLISRYKSNSSVFKWSSYRSFNRDLAAAPCVFPGIDYLLDSLSGIPSWSTGHL